MVTRTHNVTALLVEYKLWNKLMVWSLTLSVVLFRFRGLNVVVVGVLVCVCSAWHPDTLPTHSSLKKTYMHLQRYINTVAFKKYGVGKLDILFIAENNFNSFNSSKIPYSHFWGIKSHYHDLSNSNPIFSHGTILYEVTVQAYSHKKKLSL